MTDELLQLLTLHIPESQEREEGFLEITEQTHKENVNSRIYAYFLDLSRHRRVAELFRDALLQLILKKSKKRIVLDEFKVTTEVSTDKGNRIDILIADAGNESAVIIENKIYHTLQNDLVDYWNSTKVPEQKKIGVLLTLDDQSSNSIVKSMPEYFINITHIEWIKEIECIGLPSGLPHKYYTYLNDFFNSIKQLTKDIAMNEETKFFFKYQQQVLKAQNTFPEAQTYIENQIAAAASQLNWETYGKNGRWLQMWPKEQDRDVIFVVVFEYITLPDNDEPHFLIIIQLENAAINYQEELDRVARDIGKKAGLEFVTGAHGTNWIHYALKRYETNPKQLENLKNFVVNEISQFKPTYDKITEELKRLEVRAK